MRQVERLIFYPLLLCTTRPLLLPVLFHPSGWRRVAGWKGEGACPRGSIDPYALDPWQSIIAGAASAVLHRMEGLLRIRTPVNFRRV